MKDKELKMKCSNCGGKEFFVKYIPRKTFIWLTSIICVECGTDNKKVIR